MHKREALQAVLFLCRVFGSLAGQLSLLAITQFPSRAADGVGLVLRILSYSSFYAPLEYSFSNPTSTCFKFAFTALPSSPISHALRTTTSTLRDLPSFLTLRIGIRQGT
ncbi:hypothetical protein K443DRAFT_627948 [Laccaria amethystina LaAM-08-1]|uniref:Secreted protein n=1 Tax=Laccaria amethystina LaAM-08-1 TaxID=1095629 RepID=A0A0C9XAH7_9AGAR|nr:hypothetical protein K443DRAFT_627948 [Laccaria amethystina LaAM-08-1]